MKRATVVLISILAITAACSSPESRDEARTYFESLDLSSPMSAAEVFVEAYDRDDFMTVWLVLDHFAQREWRDALNLLQYRSLVRWDENLHRDLTDLYSGIVLESADYWYVFDQVMLIADRHDALLVDLEPVSLTLREVEADGGATVEGEFVGISGTVAIRLLETPLGDWRVHQVALPGGDPEQIPWAVP